MDHSFVQRTDNNSSQVKRFDFSHLFSAVSMAEKIGHFLIDLSFENLVYPKCLASIGMETLNRRLIKLDGLINNKDEGRKGRAGAVLWFLPWDKRCEFMYV